jgi:hypothetical protein
MKVRKMFYQNFDDNITTKYGVVLRNWPLQKFCSPSDIGSRNEVRVLYQAWESGTTYFQKMTEEEYNEWDKARFQNAVDQMVADDDDVDADNDLNPNPVVPTVLPIPVPQLTPIHSATVAQAALSIRPGGPDITVPPPPGPPASLDTSPISTAISKRRAPTESTSERSGKKSRPAPFESFIYAVTAADGSHVLGTKKPRKVHSDKGKKRGSRSKENVNPNSMASTSGSVNHDGVGDN